MRFRDKASGYAQIQNTRPQTLGYGLTDSPIGQAAWIYEKFLELAGDGITGDDVLSFDEVLDDITLLLVDSDRNVCRPSLLGELG
jgi:hypothetical protein